MTTPPLHDAVIGAGGISRGTHLPVRAALAPDVEIVGDGRRALELIAGMYASALTGRTVRRDELGPRHPFSLAMRGGDATAATRQLAAGRLGAPVSEATHV